MILYGIESTYNFGVKNKQNVSFTSGMTYEEFYKPTPK